MVVHKVDEDIQGVSVDYRPDVKVLDCTVRDGALINKARFDDAFVRSVYRACIAAGVDYMELGYKGSRAMYAPTEFGPWKFTSEDDIRRIVGDNPSDLKLSAMADAERTDYHTDILPKDQSVLSMIRVACYIHQIPTAIDMIKDAHDKGYETTLNLMAVSKIGDRELGEALQVIGKSPVDVIYVSDSYGSLYFQPIRDLVLSYLEVAKAGGKKVGIHAHNNQQLAFANTVEAMVLGASYLDATINGMGRGAGNCPLELLLGFLKNPKFHLRPVLECIQKTFLPLRKTMEWGYDIPYMLTGQFNEHPRYAIEFLAQAEHDDLVGFFDKLEDA
jgi:4-hydroxy 2-oxovalerate aldolase